MVRRLVVLIVGFVLTGSTASSAMASIASRAAEGPPAMGLPQDSAIDDARTRCPGSIDHVKQNMTGPDADVVEEAQGLYEELPGFRAVVHDGTTVAVVVSPNTLSEWQARLASKGVAAVASCVDDELLAAGQAVLRVRDLVGGDYILAGYDALRDAFVVRTTLDRDEIITSIVTLLPAQAQQRATGTGGPLRVVQLTRPDGSARLSRGSDDPPYKGGAKITMKFPEFGFNTQCTTGFYVNSQANGTALVSAGHCSLGLNGRWVWNGDISGLVGETEGNHFPDPDLMLIDGSVYEARSYAAADQVTIKSISGSANPATLTTYCQYGATLLRRCAQYTALDEWFCDESGCTFHLAYTEGPAGPGGVLRSGGDSGGGVFRELSGGTISARAVVVAGLCGWDIHGNPNVNLCWGADHKRQTVLSTYDATVVTFP